MNLEKEPEAEPSGYVIECPNCHQAVVVKVIYGRLGNSRRRQIFRRLVGWWSAELPLTDTPQYEIAQCQCGYKIYFNATRFQ